MDKSMAKLARRFYDTLAGPAYPWPGWFYFAAFHAGRTKMRLELDERSFDFRYYRDQGWFESDYYYPVSVGPARKLAGRLIDSFQASRTKKRQGKKT
jgi:hypothetical protein